MSPSAATTTPARTPDELRDLLHDYMQATQRLQHTHETLEREVVRLREELASKDQELERGRRLAALGELAAGVAHEVRNPLGAIQLYSGLLRNECATLAPAVRLIDKIEAGIRAIDRVVQDTLALTPRPGKFAPRRIADIVDHVRDDCRSALDARGLTLVARFDDPHRTVVADDDALRRVLVNLVTNAADVSPGGATIELDVRGTPDGQVVLRLSDRGPGLPDDVLDRLFDPFFTTKPHGTGLGLTLAHRLVAAHGGQLLARNRAEGGAEFIVILPGAGPAAASSQPVSGASETSAA
jgi:signal transduction histidine kinase